MELGNKIYELRKKHKLSQEQLADQIGVARQTISKWELGETSPDIKQAQKLSQIFDVSMDELFCKKTNETVNVRQDYKNKKSVSWRRITAICIAVVCLCLVTIGVFDVVKRFQILHPKQIDGSVVITRKGSIQIGKGITDVIVFSEENKPMIACEIPEGFVADTVRSGFYTKGEDFIKFSADYAYNVINPLEETEYYSYYESIGYNSYIEMAQAAMYYDYEKIGVFSSKKEIYLVGGAQLVRQQLCAGQNADYYAIDGGLTEHGEAMWIYGFALHFNNSTWLIMLKDCNEVYYFISIKDPNGVGETIETIGDLLSTISF